MMLKNFWYPALLSRELSGVPIERIICDVPMVFFRGAEARAAAVRAFCSHRRAPLAMGSVTSDGAIRCAYHGVCFDANGHCVDIPTQSHIPATMHIGAHPVRERYGFIWVWPGDAALAEDTALPNLPWREDAGRNNDVMAYWHISGAAELAIDNLLDLTHIAFIHHATIGYDPELLRDDPLIFETDGTTLRSTRVLDDVEPSPNHRTWHAFSGNVVRTSISEWRPPGFNQIVVRNADADVSLERRVDHFVVPETATTTHYFYALSRNFKIDDGATSQEHFAGNERVLAEDVAIIEAQQRYITAYPAYHDVAIRQDRVLIQAHKILDQLAADERTRAV